MQIARTEIVAILQELGLELWQAEQAADDPRLDWDVSALQRCIDAWQTSTANNPTAVLWSQLAKHHAFPRGKTTTKLRILTEDDAGPYICPWCKQEWSVCEGMHGWAAQYRGMAPAAIFSEEQPARPRRTRKANGERRRTDGAREDER